VAQLAQRFLPAVPQESLDALEEEVLDYKLTPSSSLPISKPKNGEIFVVGAEFCSYWQEIGRMMTLDGKPRLTYLTHLAKCALSLPVSNADTERVFSNVRKIVTEN
jgi:hypothetical protein